MTRDEALEQMQYHLARQAAWQVKVDAREEENRQVAEQRQVSRSQLTTLEYEVDLINKGDFWLKRATSNRDSHQKQVLMYAAVAQALIHEWADNAE